MERISGEVKMSNNFIQITFKRKGKITRRKRVPPPLRSKDWQAVAYAKLGNTKKYIEITIVEPLEDGAKIVLNRRILNALLNDRYDEIYLYRKIIPEIKPAEELLRGEEYVV